MNALITGGTGFIGGYLVRALIAARQRCRVLVRPGSQRATLSGLDVEFFEGDLTDADSLRGIADGVNVVYHLAATGHVTAQSAQAYQESRAINVEGTRNLINACLGAPLARFVHFSSTAAMGLLHLPKIDETAVCQPTMPYQRSKWESEQVVLGAWREQGLPAVILRPCMVYGPGGQGEFLKFCQLMSRGFFPRVGRGRNLTPLVHVRDVVQATLLAGERGRPGELYLVAGEASFEIARMRELVLAELGVRRPFIYLPLWLALLGAWGLEWAGRLTGKTPPVTRRNILSSVVDRVYDIGKAQRELGYAPRVSLEEGVAETVRWFRQEGYL
jgi:nucleoside-diphosphate-sugar epimerase